MCDLGEYRYESGTQATCRIGGSEMLKNSVAAVRTGAEKNGAGQSSVNQGHKLDGFFYYYFHF